MLTGHLPELIIVLVLGLIVFGPKRLPEIGEAMGKGIRDFKKGVSSLSDDDKPQSVQPRDVVLQDPIPAEPVVIEPEPLHRHANGVADPGEPAETVITK